MRQRHHERFKHCIPDKLSQDECKASPEITGPWTAYSQTDVKRHTWESDSTWSQWTNAQHPGGEHTHTVEIWGANAPFLPPSTGYQCFNGTESRQSSWLPSKCHSRRTAIAKCVHIHMSEAKSDGNHLQTLLQQPATSKRNPLSLNQGITPVFPHQRFLPEPEAGITKVIPNHSQVFCTSNLCYSPNGSEKT